MNQLLRINYFLERIMEGLLKHLYRNVKIQAYDVIHSIDNIFFRKSVIIIRIDFSYSN